MKKLLSLLMILVILLTSGCETASTLLVPEDKAKETESKETELEMPEIERPKSALDDDGTKGKIAKSTTYKGNNELTFFLAEKINILGEDRKDSIYFGTDAKESGGEIQWKDFKYWNLAVMADEDEDGEFDYVYNLYYGDVQGRLYVEVNEYLLQGIATPVISLYIFSPTGIELREYLFDGEFFIETISYTTEKYSTSGVNNILTTIPKPELPKPKDK